MRFLLVPIAAIAISGATASGATTNCAPVHGTLRAGRPYHLREVCRAAIVTPWVYVDRRQLKFAEQSDHNNIATFYGWGTVVRVHTIHDRLVTIAALTLAPRQHLKIRLAIKTGTF